VDEQHDALGCEARHAIGALVTDMELDAGIAGRHGESLHDHLRRLGEGHRGQQEQRGDKGRDRDETTLMVCHGSLRFDARLKGVRDIEPVVGRGAGLGGHPHSATGHLT
jgi:hypothetical protein